MFCRKSCNGDSPLIESVQLNVSQDIYSTYGRIGMYAPVIKSHAIRLLVLKFIKFDQSEWNGNMWGLFGMHVLATRHIEYLRI